MGHCVYTCSIHEQVPKRFREGSEGSGEGLRVRNHVVAVAMSVLTCGVAATPAAAQYAAGGDRATGETYRVEVGGYLWPPDPTVLITSESLGIIGTQIDFKEDLGIEKKT